VIAYLQYHKMRTGEGPTVLLARIIPPMLWWLLGVLVIIIVAGFLTAVVLGPDEGRFRSFSSGESTVVVLRASSVIAGGGTLVILGLALLVFSRLGQGWGWWIVAVGGIMCCALGVGVAGRGRRWIFAKDQVQTESLWYWKRMPEESWTLDSGRTRQLALRTLRTGGAFGQPVREEYRVLLDDRQLFTASNWKPLAEAFAQEARHAYPDAAFVENSD